MMMAMANRFLLPSLSFWLKNTELCIKLVPPGLVNTVCAVALHFCLALPELVTLPGAHLLADPCTHPPSFSAYG